MERTELLSTMKTIKDHCKNLEFCIACPIYNECSDNFPVEPHEWDFGGEDA